MHENAGVHIGHTAVANFYIGPVKKSMQIVMESAYLKDLRIICQFLFSSLR